MNHRRCAAVAAVLLALPAAAERLLAQPANCLIPKQVQASKESLAHGAEKPLYFAHMEVPLTARQRTEQLAHSRLKNARTEDWFEPSEVVSENDKIDTTLKIAYGHNTLGGVPVELRAYVDPKTGKGMLTGPTLRFKASDQARVLRVHLVNALPCLTEKCSCQPPAKEHAVHAMEMDPDKVRNNTNLHTHGLHVSPKPPQDNVFLDLGPGCDEQVEIKIPAGHLPGTFWYHAHRHGSTALQLASGMGGALIIEGKMDAELKQKGIAERLLVFQQISYKKGDDGVGRLETSDDVGLNVNTTINGQLKPKIVLHRGQVERWRMIHAGFNELLPVRLIPADRPAETVPQYLLAVDGITLHNAPVKMDVVELGAGNRADVLVRVDQPGTYRLVKEEAMRVAGEPEPDQDLAEVVVLPDGNEMPIPTSVIVEAPKDVTGTVAKQRRAIFSVEKGAFLINGKSFQDGVVDFDPKLGTVEEWTVYNCSTQDHPYHIHVNPFQITELGVPGKTPEVFPPGKRVWRDTLLIPKGKKDGKNIIPGYFKMLTHYENFDGRFVLHCHILLHEDAGMMSLVEIKP